MAGVLRIIAGWLTGILMVFGGIYYGVNVAPLDAVDWSVVATLVMVGATFIVSSLFTAPEVELDVAETEPQLARHGEAIPAVAEPGISPALEKEISKILRSGTRFHKVDGSAPAKSRRKAKPLATA